MKIFFTILLLSFSLTAYALMHFLVEEWDANGDHFCKYDNGTVLNVGYKICPLNIND